jgi:hypothetical protein
VEKFRREIKAIRGVIKVGDRAFRRRPFKATPENHNEICGWSSAGASRGVRGGELCSDGIGGDREREEGELTEAQRQGEGCEAYALSPKGEESDQAQQ